MFRSLRPGSIAVFVALALADAPSARAEAHCVGPIQDGDVWNLVCIADNSHESDDDYECDYFLSVTDSAGMTMQPEATGAVSPGQNNAVIWSSAVLGDDAAIVSADIESGSCSR